MPRGRKPLPPNVVKLRGNPGKRPIATPLQVKASMPQCPEHLSKLAKAEWRRVAPGLYAAGLLSELDRAALAAYCQCWARWVEAEQRLAVEGATVPGRGGVLKVNPLIAVASRAQRDMKAFAEEFGLSPLTRQRIRVEPPVVPDAFERLLRDD